MIYFCYNLWCIIIKCIKWVYNLLRINENDLQNKIEKIPRYLNFNDR